MNKYLRPLSSIWSIYGRHAWISSSAGGGGARRFSFLFLLPGEGAFCFLLLGFEADVASFAGGEGGVNVGGLSLSPIIFPSLSNFRKLPSPSSSSSSSLPSNSSDLAFFLSEVPLLSDDFCLVLFTIRTFFLLLSVKWEAGAPSGGTLKR